MAHAGQEVRLGLVGLFGRRQGTAQGLIQPLAFGDVARGGKNTLQAVLAVVKRGGVVRHVGGPAVQVLGGQFVVAELLVVQHLLDAGLGALRVGEKVLERRADQLVAVAARQGLHLLVDI